MGPAHQLRGYLLLLTLVLVALLFSLGLAVVQFCTHHQQWVRKAEGIALARRAAGGGIHLAIARLSQDSSWRAGLVDFSIGEAVVNLSFDRDSRVNASPHSEVEADGRILPPYCAHLVSHASARGCQATCEAIVSLPQVLYQNDFDSSASEWSQGLLGPVVAAGYYVLDLSLLQFNSLAGDADWSDYEAEFVATLSQPTGLGFLVRASGPPNRPTAYLAEYQLLRGGYSLYRLQDGVPTRLATAPAPLSGLTHTYTFRAIGSDLVFGVDGREVLKYHDEVPLSRGRIGIQPLLGTVVLVDSVRVRQGLGVRAQWRR